MKKEAIGIVMPLGIQQGGAEALLQHLLRHGSDRYQYVCAFLQEGPLVDEVRALGYDTTVIPATHLSNFPNYLKTVAALYRWIREKKLIKVFSWMSKAHLYVSPAATAAGIEASWFQHGVSNKGRMDRIITLFPAANILCCSETARTSQNRIFPSRQTEVCYPGVSFPPGELPSSEEARKTLGLPLTTPIVGMVARWERWKGPHVFIEAAQLVARTHSDAIFFIIGGAHPLDLAYADEIRTLAAQSGLGDKLILAGQRPALEVPYWQASADFIIHPVVDIEPFGMAVAEAMGMGKVVVVAATVGGPTEIIENGISGLLVPKADAPSFAAAIRTLLDNPELKSRLASAAYLRGRSFSIESFSNRFQTLLFPTSARDLESTSMN